MNGKPAVFKELWVVIAFCFGCVVCSFVTRCDAAQGQTVVVQDIETSGWSIGFSQGLRGGNVCVNGSCAVKERAMRKRLVTSRRFQRGYWFRHPLGRTHVEAGLGRRAVSFRRAALAARMRSMSR